jgi:regulatory protein
VALLAARARSAEEVRRRLRRQGYASAEIEAAVTRLTAAGYLNDAAFAAEWMRSRLTRQRLGPGRLTRELRAKGIGEAEIAAALAELTAERDVRQVAAEAATRRLAGLRGLPPATARRRLAAYLTRRGFPVEVIVALCREHFASQGEYTDDGE